MKTDATTAADQEFITLSAEEHAAYMEAHYAKHGWYPMAGGETAEAAPAAAQPGSAPGQDGDQGAQDGGTTVDAKGAEGGFNWGLFPDVPEEQRPLLEPHLKKVQGHVTKLEQQLSSFKDVQPEQVQQLVQFEQAFNQNPIQTWLAMAERMQETGLMSELDLEALKAIANGEPLGEDEDLSGEGEGGETDGEVDPTVAQLQARLDAMEQERQREQQTRQERQEKMLLDRTLGTMRTQLEEADLKDVPDNVLVAHLIANNGDAEAAVKAIVEFRNGTLKGFAEKKTKGEDELDMPKGTPKAPERPMGKRDAFREATAGAANYLARANQGG